MFGRWVRPALPVEDRVWLEQRACRAGLRTQVQRALAQDASVLLLSRSIVDQDALARDLADAAPRVGRDRFAAAELRASLRAPGALGLADVSDLRDLSAHAAPLEIHVLGRSTVHAEGATLLERLRPWAAVCIAFHLALDDALLKPHAGTLQPLLQSLGLRADECVASPMVTRAVERLQRSRT